MYIYFYRKLIRCFTKTVITLYQLFGSTNYDCEFYLQMRVLFIGLLPFSLCLLLFPALLLNFRDRANKRRSSKYFPLCKTRGQIRINFHTIHTEAR